MDRGEPKPADPLESELGRVAVAIDGKTVPGAKVPWASHPHLLPAPTTSRSSWPSGRSEDKTNEIPCVTTLLDDMRQAGHEISQMVFTLHTQHATATLPGAGWVAWVGQPALTVYE